MNRPIEVGKCCGECLYGSERGGRDLECVILKEDGIPATRDMFQAACIEFVDKDEDEEEI